MRVAWQGARRRQPPRGAAGGMGDNEPKVQQNLTIKKKMQ